MDAAPDAGQGVPDADPHLTPARYLTSDQPGLGGALKLRPEDFLVEEVPLFALRGHGEHIYLFVEKCGMNTMEMVRLISRHFNVRRDRVGFAGLKDKTAITRQLVSVHAPGRSPEDFPMLERDDLRILWAELHTEKLKRGALAGNRFVIRVRDVEPTGALVAQRVLARLEKAGVPNRFGEQRFGYLRNNHLIGRSIILGRYEEAVDMLLSPHPRSPRSQLDARARYAEGDAEGAWQAFPRFFRTEQIILNKLLQGRSARDAWMAVDKNVRSYYISAFQSAIFNAVLDRRLLDGAIDRLVEGDRAYHHERRTTFAIERSHTVEDPDERSSVSARLRAFEISPSGPMWGREMERALGSVAETELKALHAIGVTEDDLGAADARVAEMIDGTRRPLRVPLRDPDVEGGVDEHGAYVKCAFELPRGSFATTVMEEVMKTSLTEEGDDG